MVLTKATNSMILGAPSNALDTGASSDGVTDNTAAAQATLDLVDNVNGAVAVGMTELDIGYARSATTEPLNGWVSRIAYYNRRLANSELQGITA